MPPRNLTPAERDRIFGPLVVTGTSGRDTVTFQTPPPLVSVPWGSVTVKVHELAAPSLKLVRDELEAVGLLSRAKPILGFQPRRVRTVGGGNTPELSAHAYGAAVDVRFDVLPQGEPSDELQDQIAPHFERHGWFWGARFNTPDAHHFTFQGHDPSATPTLPSPAPAPTLPGEETDPPKTRAPLWGLLGAVGLGYLVSRWATRERQ